MSLKKTISLVLIFCSVIAVLADGQTAVGSISQPPALEKPAVTPVAVKPAKPSPSTPGLLAKLSNRWARFRPVAKKEDPRWENIDQVMATNKTLNQKIFDEDMSARMRERYYGTVSPIEKEVLNPYRRSNTWERQRYEESRKELASWTLKEVGRAQLKDFVQRRKKDSAALGVVAATTGMQDDPKDSKAEARLTEEERIARAHRADFSSLTKEEEEVIPTRLRAKLNVLKTQGQLTFSNPIVTTSVEARAGSGENLAVELNREFKKLEMKSKVRYGVDESLLVLNVNKKITEQVSLDLNSERWGGSKRSNLGEKSRDTAKVTYSVSF